MYDPDLEIALSELRDDCRLICRTISNYDGNILACYDVICLGMLRKRKIAEIIVTNKKVKITNLTKPLYGFQKDELMDLAVRETLRKLKKTQN